MASPEVRLLLAIVESAMADTETAAAAQFESARLRIVAQAAGGDRLRLPAETSPEVRSMFARPDVVEALLGRWSEDHVPEVASAAGLLERESEALSLLIVPIVEMTGDGEWISRPPEVWEIARDMGRGSRQRRRRGMPLAEETVENYLSGARVKLRRFFGL